MTSSKALTGKVALVTGAGGGIGQAVATRLAADGAVLVLTDRDGQLLSPVASTVRELGVEAWTLETDLTDAQQCDALVNNAIDLAGRLDIVVNNAGVMRRGNILDSSDEDYALSFKVNVEAPFRICRAAITRMRDSGGGAIVNLASCWGLYPGPDHVVYCTSKAALAAMTRCLARDHAGDGIRINAVCPNEVNTPMLKTGFEIRGLDPERALEDLNRSVPLGRIAEPEDIADVVAFLVSDQSRYLAGSLIEVNGAKPVF